jgi:rhodanese-related sulfurtransferase
MLAMEFEVTPEQARAELAKGARLLDVREPGEVALASVGGVNIPMGEIPARVQELDPDEHILVLCHRGVRSLNVTVWLRQQGFENVQSIRGGISIPLFHATELLLRRAFVRFGFRRLHGIVQAVEELLSGRHNIVFPCTLLYGRARLFAPYPQGEVVARIAHKHANRGVTN